MSGRNPSRRNFGRRGRHGLKNNNNYGRRKASTKKTLQDLKFYVVSKKEASDYENTAFSVINFTKKDFDRGKDIYKALQNLEYENTEN